MRVWLLHPGGRVETRVEPFVPRFFASARTPSALNALAARLADLPGVGLSREAHLLGLGTTREPVLRVDVPRIADFASAAKTVDRLGNFRDYDLFDVDVRLSHQFLIARQTFPLARVDAATLLPQDAQWAQEYDPPPVRIARLDVEVASPPGVPAREEHPVRSIELRGEGSDAVRLEGGEAAMLEDLGAALREADPDVLVTDGGDRFLVGYLHHRAGQHGVPLQLGRRPDPVAPARKERSFVSYGRVRFRPKSEALHGRVHLDASSSFFYGEAGLAGLMDLARIASVPVQELARLEAGTAVTSIQIDCAKREGRLVPYKKNVPEAPKSELVLLAADRGGLIFDPIVGLHGPVVELDFSSMYPNIMVTRNVSPETIECACCSLDEAQYLVPQVGYRTCRKPGFVGRALGPLVARREALKKRAKTAAPAERERLQAACDAMKWLCVCSFGYQGYRNARFGRIECHEAICAWGRELLLQAAEIAREHGFEVLHGIVDSVWLEPFWPGADAAAFAADASRQIGIPLGVEGWYDWVVFLPTRQSAAGRGGGSGGVGPLAEDVGAMNRFYGAFRERPAKKARSQAGQPLDFLDGGRIKVRGVEMRQHSAPGIVSRAQEAFLSEVGQARTPEDFRARLPRALAAAQPLLDRLRAGQVPVHELLVTNSVQQEEENYKSNTMVRCALLGLKAAGVRVTPGDSVTYLVTDASATRPRQRATEARLLRGGEAGDPAWYERLVLRALASCTLPFGWNEENLALFYQGQRQLTLA